MTTYKNTSGDYIITVDSGTGTLTVYGNMDVIGNITYVDDLSVTDAFITVADENDGSVTQMGLIAQKTSNTYAGLRFNTVTNDWEISSSTNNQGSSGTWAAISAGMDVAGSNTQVQFNDEGVFGATANLTFDKNSNKLTLTGHQVYGNIGSAPSAVANAVAVYNNTTGEGSTGLYVISNSANGELISASKAKLFALIF